MEVALVWVGKFELVLDFERVGEEGSPGSRSHTFLDHTQAVEEVAAAMFVHNYQREKDHPHVDRGQ